MRLSVDHLTGYRFTAPQSRLVQMLRLTPENSHDQTIASWQIHVDCDARMKAGRDGFGNAVTMLYVQGPIGGIEISVSGEVLTSHSDGVVHGAHEPFPAALYLRETLATRADPAIIAFAHQAVSGEASLLGKLHALNRAFHARFALDAGRPVGGMSAAVAFARETATPRDMAQMFLVAARSIGAPARYISGYGLTEFEDGHRPTPHGWAEAHVDGLGWVGFDPCTGRSPEDGHIRVAMALDAAGAAPLAGSRLGEGDEELAVDVQVMRED